MGIFKGFTVSIYANGTDTPFASCILSVLQSNGGTISRAVNPADNYLSNATDEYILAMGSLFCGPNSFNEFITDIVNHQIPLAEKKELPLPIPSGAYLRFTNSSGAYMEIPIINNAASLGLASLYDTNGVYIGSTNSLQLYYNAQADKESGTPYISPPVIIGNIVNGVLESANYNVQMWGNYGGTSNTLIVEVGSVDANTIRFINMLGDYDPQEDPYAPGGETEKGGGGGSFDDPSEDVTDPSVPDISAVDTGFITLFNPSVSQLNSLASYMWSSGFDLDTFKKMFANPMDCILGLSILPKIVPAGGSRAVIVGNISTGVNMTVAASQYVKFDCGSVNVKRYSNSFLDYAPYTKVSIYLPFIGIHELSVDDVMNKSVHVKYNIDILSGACVAFVICDGTTLYTYTGQCAASVPVTSGDWSNMINGVIGAVGGALKAAVGGAVMGGIVGGIGAGVASLASSAMDVAGMKPSIEHSGNMGGMGGMMGVKTPFLIITRPQQAIPGQQNKYTGYPAFITKKLDDLVGYTEIEEIHLENIPATENEITEIYDILKSGVIL